MTAATRYDDVTDEALDRQRIEDALIDATQSLVYLRIMRDERAAVYETIVGLLRKAINDDA